MRTRVGWIVAVALLFRAADGSAGSLSDGITEIFGPRGITLDVRPPDPRFPPHTAHFSSDSLATLGLLVSELATTAADFPAVSTVPGFTYRFNPDLEVFERAPGPLGPVFVERPQTLGAGKFDVGVSYLYVDFDELNGESLDGLDFGDLGHNDCCAGPPSPGVPAFENDHAELSFEKFELTSHVITFFATYGITDRWDVNVVLPVIQTSLDVRARAEVLNESGAPIHFFDNETQRTVETRTEDDDKLGVGDLQLRTKYRILDNEMIGLAAGGALRLETGDEDDFQGIGSTTFTPFVAVAKAIGIVDLHANGGIEINFDDSDQTRIRWATGATVQLGERVALLADFLGSSSIATDRLKVEVPTFVENPSAPQFETVESEVSTDIVDFAPGVKVMLSDRAVAFATVFVPINDDGLRADFVPAGGIEVTF